MQLLKNNIVFVLLALNIVLGLLLFNKTSNYKIKIDNLQEQIKISENKIKNLEKLNEIRFEKIDSLKVEITKVESDIKVIEKEKLIIKEIYNEEFKFINTISGKQLDSLFSIRY